MTWTAKKSVVVPVDFSEESQAALDVGLDYAGDAKNLHVVHVLAPLTPVEPAVMWNTMSEDKAAEFATEELRARVKAPRFEGCDLSVVFGSPAPEIVEYAEKVNADMIVIPSHGRTGLSRLLIGSVAERVVRMAHCPVLVLRT